jgi:hypothetical protein
MAPGQLAEGRPQSPGEFRKTIEPQVKEVPDHRWKSARLDSIGHHEHDIPVRQEENFQRDRRTSILPASSVTTDFDELRFEAAAGRQLQIRSAESERTPSTQSEKEDPQLLISSPYNHPSHLLNLLDLDIQNRLLSLALTGMKPILQNYATADYLESFNWNHVLSTLRQLAKNEGHEFREQKFYTVIFRSKLNKDIDRDRLGDLDQHSHREATESGGLLKYWFGAANEGGENLATCMLLL